MPTCPPGPCPNVTRHPKARFLRAKHLLGTAAAIALLVAAGRAPADIRFNVVDLGTLGGSTSKSFFVNNYGAVTGTADVTLSNNTHHAFLNTGTRMLDLGTLGGSYSTAYYIEPTLKIVGAASVAAGANRAFLYDSSGMHNLGSLSSSSFAQSSAFSMNDSGIIVGRTQIATGQTHAFRYDTSMHDIGTLGGAFSTAWGINNAGLIVGEATLATNEDHAFRYDGTMHDLGTLGGTSSVGIAVNASGIISGYSTTAAAQTCVRGWRDHAGHLLPWCQLLCARHE